MPDTAAGHEVCVGTPVRVAVRGSRATCDRRTPVSRTAGPSGTLGAPGRCAAACAGAAAIIPATNAVAVSADDNRRARLPNQTDMMIPRGLRRFASNPPAHEP
jgi:hypothetical protein